MPKRKYPIKTGKFYHIYNISINKEKIFTGRMKNRFMDTMNYYYHDPFIKYSDYRRFSVSKKLKYLTTLEPKLQCVAWSIMPTHFHMTVREVSKGAVTRFTQKLQVSFARSYNIRKQRKGHVFAEKFDAKPINSLPYLLYLTKYIHLNPYKASLVNIENLKDYKYTSLRDYFKPRKDSIVMPELILKYFSFDPEVYMEYLRTPGVPIPE